MEMFLLDSLENTFQSEDDCEMFLIKSRWSDGFLCPRCDHNSFYKLKTRKLLECKECRTQVSITAGTVMHKSKLPLLVWFKAIQIVIQDEMTYSISSFASTLGVNYRTAKLMLEKLQLALNKRYARMDSKRYPRSSEENLQQIPEQTSEVTPTVLRKCSTRKNTGCLSAYLFKTSRNVKYAEVDIWRRWMDAFFSVYLYPYFLRYFQVR